MWTVTQSKFLTTQSVKNLLYKNINSFKKYILMFYFTAETLSEDENEDNEDLLVPKDGPFSAITTSMWPQDCAIDLSPVTIFLG